MKILLAGPNVGDGKSAYGGGVGGYTRNMTLYLKEFSNRKYNLKPFFHTVRKKNEIKLLSFPTRFFKDGYNFIKELILDKPDAVHILGQYRTAIPREFFWCLICRLVGLPYVYEIKAGKFKDENEEKKWHLFFSWFIIKNASLVLCEGQIYVNYLIEKFNKESFYFPNVVALDELPPKRVKWLENKIKILFVGYCYEGKGVFELIEGANKISKKIPIEIFLVGEEDPSFTKWIEKINLNDDLSVNRLGRKPHKEVLKIMRECDIYCYPSKHEGEGHNNTINEAMMNEMIIISSKAGFLEDVLENIGYFISQVNSNEINKKIEEVLSNKDESISRAKKGRKKIIEQYNSAKLRRHLFKLYDENLFYL